MRIKPTGTTALIPLPRLQIVCRECGKSSQNAGRGLCGVCYGRLHAAGNVSKHPKLPRLPRVFSARPEIQKPAETVTLQFTAEDQDILEKIKSDAQRQRRPIDLQIMYILEMLMRISAKAMKEEAA